MILEEQHCPLPEMATPPLPQPSSSRSPNSDLNISNTCWSARRVEETAELLGRESFAHEEGE
jgi:hypothetical protein